MRCRPRARSSRDLAAAGERSAQRQSARKDGSRLTSAGFAFSNTKTAIAHSLSYPITLRHGVPHGIACSFSLPIIIRGVSDKGGICAEGLQAIFGSDHEGASKQLAATLEKLGVSTDYRSYGIADEEFRERHHAGVRWRAWPELSSARRSFWRPPGSRELAAQGCRITEMRWG